MCSVCQVGARVSANGALLTRALTATSETYDTEAELADALAELAAASADLDTTSYNDVPEMPADEALAEADLLAKYAADVAEADATEALKRKKESFSLPALI